ncbi:MAG: TonB-dependent receptor [Opitutaceae bacterium]
MKNPTPRTSLIALISSIAALTATAQQVNPGSREEEIIELPAFEVESTYGTGYISHQALSGFKTRKSLLEIPQAITIVPRDLIDDVAQYRNEVDIVKYASAGIVAEHKGGQPHIRGFRSNVILEDGLWDNTFSSADSANADSYEVLRGPAAVMFGGRPTLAGIIVRNTKKPRMERQESLRVIVGSEDFYRGEVDLTGPISENFIMEGGKLAYRLVGVVQKDDGFPTGDKDDRTGLYPSLQLTLPQTVFRLQGELSEQKTGGVPIYFFNEELTGLYVGSDSGRNQNWKEDWSEATFSREKLKLTVQHQLSDGWDIQVAASRNNHDRADYEVRHSSNPNWTDMTIGQMYFHNGNYGYVDVLTGDIVGKYSLFGLDQESYIGLYGDRWTYDGYRRTADLGSISLVNPVFNRQRPDAADLFAPLAENTPNFRLYQQYLHAAYSHTVYAFERKLAVVVGLAANETDFRNYDLLTSSTIPSFAQKETENTRRIGAVYRPAESIAVFVNNSTTFAPQANQDFAGNFLPPTIGEVIDIGVKFSLPDDRIVGSVTYFDLSVTNLRVPDFDHPGSWLAAGEQDNKGFEIELALRPIDQLQLVATYYHGDIKDAQTGIRLNNSVNDTASFWIKYNIDSGPLKGLSVGGGAYHQGFRLQSGTIGWPSYTLYNLFLSYSVNEHLGIQLNVENLADKLYSPGGFNVTRFADYGTPRNAKLTLNYRF